MASGAFRKGKTAYGVDRFGTIHQGLITFARGSRVYIKVDEEELYFEKRTNAFHHEEDAKAYAAKAKEEAEAKIIELEKKLTAQRAKVSMAKAKDPQDVFKALEAEERQAFVEFERRLKEKREKALAAILEPLRKQREKAKAERDEAEGRLIELDRQIDKITGRPTKTTGKRQRSSPEQLKANAERAVELLKNGSKTGSELRSKGVDTGGLPPQAKRFKLGNIKVEGRGPNAKYTLA